MFIGLSDQVDHGKHGLTALSGGCVKVWEMWPPTDDNLKIYRKCFANPALWKGEEDKLKHACYAVTTEDLAIHLRPGWLHATTTLRGGGTSGIEFTSADCLRVATRVWSIESSVLKKEPAENWPFVEAILSALDHKDTQDEGLAVLCEVNSKLALSGPQKTELANRLRSLGMECRKCGEIGKDHAQMVASTHTSTGKRRKRGPI
jgi:hypothetical protein